MNGGFALMRHSARRVRILILSMAGLLAAFQVLFTLAANSLQELNAFDRITALFPDFVRQLLGSSLITVMSFRGIACLGYFHVAVVATLVGLAIAIATEPATEIESRFLDLVLSHPLRRHWVITRSIALLGASILFVVSAMMIATRAGLYWLVSTDVARTTFQVVPLLSLNLGVLLMCWGAVALGMAAASKRRSVASACAGLLAMAAYLADVISQVWEPLKRVARFSPFHYYRPLNLVTGNAGVSGDILTLAGVAAAGFAVAYLLFQRRDL